MRRKFLKVIGVGIIMALTAQLIPIVQVGAVETDSVEECRETIDMGETPWKFIGSDVDPETAKQIDYDDSSWQNVGIPHCFNDMDTFTNTKNVSFYKGTVWYRKTFTMDASYEGKKVFLEFEGVNLGVAVYVNGVFKPGNTEVEQPDEVTHVGGFLPFTLDITDDLNYGGENVIAVRVSNANGSFLTWPGFGVKNDFGMDYGGIVCPVYMHITNPVHIPSDVYSPIEKWGTYIATLSADEEQAEVAVQTNVENESGEPQSVTLTTQIVDADGAIVWEKSEDADIEPGEIRMFDQRAIVEDPTLWYPNASIYGTPYLYKVYSIVKTGGVTVDVYENTLGIRTIDWDTDYCYINGKKHLLNGFGNRNTYPALGSAVPAELLWRDVELIAQAGGNALRVGHVPATEETVAACDQYGVLIIQNSGDDEWSIHDEPANTYKREYDRDMIICDRNHPSIAVWEANNGVATSGVNESPESTWNSVNEYDYLAPRIVHSRDKTDFNPPDGKMLIRYTNWFWKQPNYPSMNMEAYGAKFSDSELDNCIARFDYENEKQFSEWYVNEYNKEISEKACGFIDWMLVETWGEGYTKYLDGKRNQKSLGSSAMDGNRIPKLKYNIWKNAVWTPYEIKPGVTLQSHWNYNTGSIQTVDAWSNCPKVELFVDGVSQGVRTPNANKRCTWNYIRWQKGEIKAVGLDENGNAVCEDIRVSSGEPHHIELTVQPMLTKPDGETFELKANGSDAAIIVAKVVDEDGNWCPLADDNIRFSVSGPASYRGSYNFFVDESHPESWHSPGDYDLQAEGGIIKVAVRTGFDAGTVTVKAEADGLAPGETTFTTTDVDNPFNVEIPDFNITGYSTSGQEIASLPVGENEVWATYQSNTDQTKDTVFITALKKNGMVIATYSEEKTFAPYEEYRFEQTIDVPEILDEDDVSVEFYLWDGTDTLRPETGAIKQKINNTNPIITINDTIVGEGVNQIQYFGDWGYSNNEMCYFSDNHWTNDSTRYCILTFEGIQATYYGVPYNNNGIAAISVDGGEETMVDLYSPSTTPSAPMYTTPILPYGIHTLKVRVTGDKNSNSEYNWVNIDRFDIRTR